MVTIREEAKQYEAPQTRNISELDKVPVDAELHDGERTDKDNQRFVYKYIVVDDHEYRVPGSVIGGIKTLLNKFPELKYVTVLREGEKLNTRYQVIPYYDQPTTAPQTAQQDRVGQQTINS